MLANLARFIRPGAQTQNPYQYLIPQVVDGLGSDVAKVSNFENRLLPAIEHACAYLDRQIGMIPGGFHLSEASFDPTDPVSLLLGEPANVSKTLGRSLEVKSSLPGLMNKDNEFVFALLGMRAERNQTPGSAATIFADHTLATLAPSEEESRKFLRYVAFMRMVNNSAAFSDGIPQQGIRSVSHRSAEEKLGSLLSLLQHPESFFHLASSGFRIPVRSPGEPGTRALMELPLLHCSDRRQWIVCFVRFSIADAVDAQAREMHKHRYIYL